MHNTSSIASKKVLSNTLSSSKLSLWLAFGSISPRAIYAEVKKYEREIVKNMWEIRVSPWLRSLFFVFMSYWISALLFYFGSTKASGRSLFSAGALVTTLLFMLTSYGFTLYLDYFATYNQLYGSIGAILILMLYIWLNANVLLLGFELNAAIGKLKQDS